MHFALSEPTITADEPTSSLCFYSGIALSGIVSVLLLAFDQPLLAFLGTQPEMWADAQRYLRILAVGTVFMLAASTTSMLIRSEGAMREALFGNLAGTVTNIVLDPLFILVFGWGVVGAAVADIGSAVIAAILFAATYRKVKKELL